jgi:hypothetical protein
VKRCLPIETLVLCLASRRKQASERFERARLQPSRQRPSKVAALAAEGTQPALGRKTKRLSEFSGTAHWWASLSVNSVRENDSFAPSGLSVPTYIPGLAPWAVFLSRFAAGNCDSLVSGGSEFAFSAVPFVQATHKTIPSTPPRGHNCCHAIRIRGPRRRRRATLLRLLHA